MGGDTFTHIASSSGSRTERMPNSSFTSAEQRHIVFKNIFKAIDSAASDTRAAAMYIHPVYIISINARFFKCSIHRIRQPPAIRVRRCGMICIAAQSNACTVASGVTPV